MFFNKYKVGRNHGLLPKISNKYASQALTTYAILEQLTKKQYELHRHPNNANSFFMYNDKEYLQRNCQMILNNISSTERIKQIRKLYPAHEQTLTLYVSNSPIHSDTDILGHDEQDSLISLAFRDLKQRKKISTALLFSVIGIQNQNSLTDELNFQWIQKGINGESISNMIKATLKVKQKLKLIKQAQINEYIAHNLSIHSVKSISELNEILKKYKQIKYYFEEWVSINQQSDYFSQGQLYHLFEAQYDEKDRSVTKIIRSHYILRVNQYLRSTSAFLLKLGLNFRNISEQNHNLMQIHESKIFRLLSHCFTAKNTNNSLEFHFHLFLQVGFYPSIKEQYLNLSIFSKQSLIQSDLNQNKISKIPFVYLKQFRQFVALSRMINQYEQKKSPQQQIRNYLESQADRNEIKLRKVKSYASDTRSSLDRKMFKHRRLTQQMFQANNQVDLQHLVDATSKMSNQIYVKETKLSKIKQSSAQKANTNKQISLKKFNRREKIFCKEYNMGIQRLTEAGQSFHQDIQYLRESSINKFYEKTKKWLDLVYGQSLAKRFKNIKSQLHKNDRKQMKKINQNRVNRGSKDNATLKINQQLINK